MLILGNRSDLVRLILEFRRVLRIRGNRFDLVRFILEFPRGGSSLDTNNGYKIEATAGTRSNNGYKMEATQATDHGNDALLEGRQTPICSFSAQNPHLVPRPQNHHLVPPPNVP